MQKNLGLLNNWKFFTGMENYEENNAIPSDKFYYAQNSRFDGKVVSSKKGFLTLGDMLTGGTKFRGLFNYTYIDGTGVEIPKLIGHYNLTFYEYNEATQVWDAITTVWPDHTDVDIDGTSYRNRFYAVSPTATDGVGKIENATFTAIPDSPNGSCIVAWVERLWVTGDKMSPGAWIASKPATSADPYNVEIFDTTDGALAGLVGDDAKSPTAMRVLGSNLYIFKNDSIYYNTPESVANEDYVFKPLSLTGGAISQKSTIVVENDIWFLTPNLEVRSLGLERELGTNPRTRVLSEIIKRFMNELEPIQDNPVMIYSNRVVKLYLKSRGAPTNNVTILYDYNTSGWAVDTGQAVTFAAVYAGYERYAEDGTGQAFTNEIGFTANGVAYRFQANTGFIDNGRPDIYNRARYIHFRGKQSYLQPVTLKLYRDGSYDNYSTHVIPSPQSRGVTPASVSDGGQWGDSQFGGAVFGGAGGSDAEITMYQTDELISIDRKSNMFALGVDAEINGGKVVCEQLILKVIGQNESYKRTDL